MIVGHRHSNSHIHKVKGTLYVVATPIGNLEDITIRALQILKTVDKIAAEDTRHTRRLLEHFSIQKPILSLHKFNEKTRAVEILNCLQAGETIALVSDAGTPLISDPGHHLIAMVNALTIPLVPIPGPCALIAALSVAGFPADRFVFEGFLPAKPNAREKHLQGLVTETRTLIFYEAPHRVLSTLQTMAAVFQATRKALVARELTKKYETLQQGTLAQLMQWMEASSHGERGEFVIVVAGESELRKEEKGQSPITVLKILLKALPLNQAVKLAGEITGERKNILYDEALKWKQASE